MGLRKGVKSELIRFRGVDGGRRWVRSGDDQSSNLALQAAAGDVTRWSKRAFYKRGVIAVRGSGPAGPGVGCCSPSVRESGWRVNPCCAHQISPGKGQFGGWQETLPSWEEPGHEPIGVISFPDCVTPDCVSGVAADMQARQR